LLSAFLRSIGIYKVYEKWLLGQIKKHRMPAHIGVILDGNRRWALGRALSSIQGHKYGVKIGEEFLKWCLDLDIKAITAYVFSTENFQRPKNEVEHTLKLIGEEAIKLINDKQIHENRVRVKTLGKINLLPKHLQNDFHKIEEATKDYSDYYLNIAIAYGGRTEIVDATRKIAENVKEGKISLKEIDENLFRKNLYTAHLPNPYPDLIIRTSGEERLSGFLLWQSAYSELCFLDVFWPDFRKIDLLRAIRTFQKRVKRFGR